MCLDSQEFELFIHMSRFKSSRRFFTTGPLLRPYDPPQVERFDPLRLPRDLAEFSQFALGLVAPTKDRLQVCQKRLFKKLGRVRTFGVSRGDNILTESDAQIDET